jgi:uncharacterized protein (TIGR03435 family)
MRSSTLAATAALVAIVGTIAIAILHPEPGLAQLMDPGADSHVAFEAVSIKPSPVSDEGREPGMRKENFGGIDYKYMAVSSLIQKAYGIKDYQLILRRGYRQREWHIVARSPANSRVEDVPLMLRSLLAERFHLAFHRETKEMPVYELVVAKGGSRLKEVDPPGGGLGGTRTAEGMVRWNGKTPLATLVRALTSELRMPVIDKTGIQGIFDLDFEYAPPATGNPSNGAPTASLPGPTISDAMEKALGLKLQARKDPVQILVVDRLEETPTAN